MSQIAFGVTQGPNGPQMTTMIIPTPSAPTPPQSYESYLETPEGVFVKIIYHTDNKPLADRYADHMDSVVGWKVLAAPVTPPESLMSKIGTAWAAAVAIPFFVGLAAFLFAMVAHMGNWISFDAVTETIGYSARYGLLAFPIIGLVLTGIAIFTHSSAKQHA